MTAPRTLVIRNVSTGVPGLDTVLGGGLCEYSVNLIAGAPGTGKTVLTQQIIFANATPERPALYFTVLGEPPIKMLRYQRQFAFFDTARVPSAVRFVNLTAEAARNDLDGVLDRIVAEVDGASPAFVAIDSFGSIGAGIPAEPGGIVGLARFIQRLSQHLTSWEITSFLVDENVTAEQRHPVFTISDSILWLSEDAYHQSTTRNLRIMKIRGRAPMPGRHSLRITPAGMEVFPRLQEAARPVSPVPPVRRGTGVPGLDEMVGGGIPAGDVVLITGPGGTGKTTFAAQFLADGLSRDERCVVAVFEEQPEAYLGRIRARAVDVDTLIERGRFATIHLRPLDLSVDEMLAGIRDAVQRVKATRVVIDSLSGFELALAPAFRADFRESLCRLAGGLAAAGVTIVMTADTINPLVDDRCTTDRVSFITDDVIAQRIVEIGGHLRKVVAVVKMRGSEHATDFRFYELTPRGAIVGESLSAYQGITTGVPRRVPEPAPEAAR